MDNLNNNVWEIWRKKKSDVYGGYDDANGLCVVCIDAYALSSLYIYNGIITDNLAKYKKKLSIDVRAYSLFLKHGFLMSPQTFYNDVFKLPAGCVFLVNTHKLTWKLITPTPPLSKKTSDSVLKEILNFKLEDEELPLALAFSGGLDSSLLLSTLAHDKKPAKLLTVEVENGRSEKNFQEIANKNISYPHIVEKMSASDAVKSFDRLSNDYEIFGHPIVLKYDFLTATAANKGFKTLMTGEGSDDILTINMEIYNKYMTANPAAIPPINNHLMPEAAPLFLPQYQTNNDAQTKWMLYNFALIANANIKFLAHTAKNNGVRLYLPYIGTEMLKYCLANAKDIANAPAKTFLKKYAQGKVPDDIINRSKQGFRSDSEQWFMEDNIFNEKLKELLCNCPTFLPEGLKTRTKNLLDLHQKSTDKGFAAELFCVMMLLSWLTKGKGLELQNDN